MSPKQKHHVLVHSGARSVPALRPHTVPIWLQVDLRPVACYKVKSVEVVSVVTIITPENIHGVLVNNS